MIGFEIFMKRLTEKVRNHRVNYSIEEAVERAVDECIREGVLADFLRSQRAEAIAMSIFEYNEEEELKKIRKSEYLVGETNGFERGLAQGEAKGKAEGKAEGEAIGKAKGEVKGKAESLLIVLSAKGKVSPRLTECVLREKDDEKLEDWLLHAATAESIEEFEKYIS